MIVVSISYFYLLHAFWLGVGAYEAWSVAGTAMDTFGFPVITRSCLLILLAGLTALVGIGLRLMTRWAYLLVTGLSCVATLVTLCMTIRGVLGESGLSYLVISLLGFACHGTVLALLHTDRLQLAFGPINWRKIIKPGFAGIVTAAWLFLAVIQMNLEGQKSIRIVIKPHPTLWSIYACTIPSRLRDQDGFVYPSREEVWYRNWTYLSSYQLAQFNPENIW
jgi:hypothetical protein